MENKSRVAFHHFLRAAILAGFAFYIVFLIRTGNMVYYIAPRMVIYTKLAAAFFYIVAVFQFYTAFRSLGGLRINCDCEHDHSPSRSKLRSAVVYGLFLLPLLAGFVLPDAAMGSGLAAKRGINLNGSRAFAEGAAPQAAPSGGATANPSPADVTDAQLAQMFKADQYNGQFAELGKKLYRENLLEVKPDGFIEALSTIDLFQNNFIGRQMEISGFVYKDDAMASDQFIVARFAVSCCSADATPFGIMIESGKAGDFAKDSWVDATGVIGTTTYNGNEVIKIDATDVKTIPAEKDPYVYPSYAFTG